MILPLMATLYVGGTIAAASAAEAPKPAAKDESGPTALGSAKAWSAYSANEKNTPVCYVVGRPAKSLPANATRGRIDLQVTHRPGEKALYVVDFELGYIAKTGGAAELDIDGKKFALFTNKDSAWASDAATDKAVALALSKGKRATLKATSERGTATTDTYALDGFGQALALADKACKVKR
jgi:invasion protein IalB